MSTVTFYQPRNHSRVSWRQRIPPIANTAEAHGGRVLKWKRLHVYILLARYHPSAECWVQKIQQSNLSWNSIPSLHGISEGLYSLMNVSKVSINIVLSCKQVKFQFWVKYTFKVNSLPTVDMAVECLNKEITVLTPQSPVDSILVLLITGL